MSCSVHGAPDCALFCGWAVVFENHLTLDDGWLVYGVNTTFNNISVISWRSVLLVEETGVLWRQTVKYFVYFIWISQYITDKCYSRNASWAILYLMFLLYISIDKNKWLWVNAASTCIFNTCTVNSINDHDSSIYRNDKKNAQIRIHSKM
jgi:hypothetical protein